MNSDGTNDPKQIWQGQQERRLAMSLNEIRRKTRKHENERRLVGILSLPVFMAATLFFAYRIYRQQVQHLQHLEEGRWDVVMLVWVLLSLYFVWSSISMIRTRRLPVDAGMMTSIQACRSYLQWETAHARRVFAGMAIGLGIVYVGAVGIWLRSALFPIADAVEFSAAYILIGMLCVLGFRHHRSRNQAELAHLDSLERDA